MKHAKNASVSTRNLRRRINRALAHSRASLWFPNDADRGPYKIMVGNTVQASSVEDLEALGRNLGVMREWEVWDEGATPHRHRLAGGATIVAPQSRDADNAEVTRTLRVDLCASGEAEGWSILRRLHSQGPARFADKHLTDGSQWAFESTAS